MELPARERDRDLAAVEMSREDDVERVGGHPAHDPWEVTEQDAERRVGVGELCGSRSPAGIRPRLDADDLHREPAELELDRFVTQHRDPVDLGEDRWIDPLRERVATVRKVVVPEHDQAGPELAQKPRQELFAAPPRHEVAGDADEVRARARRSTRPRPSQHAARGTARPGGDRRGARSAARRAPAGRPRARPRHSLPQPPRPRTIPTRARPRRPRREQPGPRSARHAELSAQVTTCNLAAFVDVACADGRTRTHAGEAECGPRPHGSGRSKGQVTTCN